MAQLSELLKERGYVHQFSSEKLEEITDSGPRTFYFGVDPTADSMHVGQLQGMLVLRRFLEAGHRLIVIVGGGTGMIGDPGGKSEERNLLSDDVVARNAEALRAQFSRLFAGAQFEMLNNAQWLAKASLMEFLRDVGKHFTVNEMIKRDSVRPRIETPDQSISFTEFSYMLLQAYDFLHLHEKYDCTLQVGGSDQWGNMVSGIDLIRRTAGRSAYAFSWPLLVNKSTGKKFGKSEGGAVWLDAKKTSAFQFYQFWLNVEDDMAQECLLKMTMLSRAEIDAAMTMHKRAKGERHAQKLLAREVCALVHGKDAAERAEKVSDALFGGGSLAQLSSDERALLKHEAPSCAVQAESNIVDVLVGAKLASSKREARQFLADGAVSLNDSIIEDESLVITSEQFQHGLAILKRGRRSVCVLVLE